MSSNLKCCPFCGGDPELRHDIKFHYAVKCSECEACGPRHHDPNDAMLAWNSNHRQELYLRMIVGQLLFRISETLFIDFSGKLKAEIAHVRQVLKEVSNQ